MKIIYLFLLIQINIFAQNKFEEQEQCAKEVIRLINAIRKNPKDYFIMYRTFNIDDYVVSKTQLKYDKELSLACYEYAKYLATTNTFEHSHCGLAESLSMGEPPIMTILGFLNEYNSVKVGETGHRRHILGCDVFRNDTKIGVGFYYIKGTYYTVIRTK